MEIQFCETCSCGKSFAQPSAFTNHQCHCLQSKQQLSNAISAARDIWNEKHSHKQPRFSDAIAQDPEASRSHPKDAVVEHSTDPVESNLPAVDLPPAPEVSNELHCFTLSLSVLVSKLIPLCSNQPSNLFNIQRYFQRTWTI
jgi:hypothetical protein